MERKQIKTKIGVGSVIKEHIPAWVKGFDQDTSVFSIIGVTISISQFQKPENLLEGEITKC